MYMMDRRSMEFIDGVHEFIKVAENHKYGGFVSCPCKNCKMRRITHHQEPSTVTYSVMVSYRTIMFGPSMEKEE